MGARSIRRSEQSFLKHGASLFIFSRGAKGLDLRINQAESSAGAFKPFDGLDFKLFSGFGFEMKAHAPKAQEPAACLFSAEALKLFDGLGSR